MSFSPLEEARRRAAAFRAYIVAGLVGAMFVVVGARTVHLAVSAPEPGAPGLASDAAPVRGELFDRNGVLLASTAAGVSVIADPSKLWDAASTARRLSEVLDGVDADALERRLADRASRFAYVKRNVSEAEGEAVFRLGLGGVALIDEPQRFYPSGALAGQALGYVDVDGKGLSGLELALEERLAAGEDVTLSFDMRVQAAVEEELAAASLAVDAAAAAGVVLDAHTGEVLALASWPEFDPNDPRRASPEQRRNHAVSAVYELGSVFKPLTIAAGLETGAVDLADRFDLTEPIRIPGAVVRDKHPHSTRANLADIVATSSNVGTVSVALSVGPERLQAFFAGLGLLDRPTLELVETARPYLPARWDQLTSAIASYGHGPAVSPFAMAAAYSAFANDGVMTTPTLLRVAAQDVAAGARVMAAPTARAVAAMMRETIRAGTGRRLARVDYAIAGKTGTANKPGPGGYDLDRRVTTFAAILPADAPRYVLVVTLDEPKIGLDGGENAEASRTAGPVAGRIVERIAPILGVPPARLTPAPEEPAAPVIRVSERSL